MHGAGITWVLRSIAKPLLPGCSCKGIRRGIHIQILIDLVITVLCILLAYRNQAWESMQNAVLMQVICKRVAANIDSNTVADFSFTLKERAS